MAKRVKKMSLTDNDCAQHVATGGGVCPFCGSDEVEGDSINTGGGEATQEMACNDCNATWLDHYTLTGITVTCGPD
jgi:hypothetical protein